MRRECASESNLMAGRQVKKKERRTTMEKEARQLRIGVLGCGPIAQAAHLEACRKARNAGLYALCDQAEDLVTRMAVVHEPQVTYLNYDAIGSLGHLDLTIAVRMDWHEGFQVYGEYGSVIGKTYNPWYLRSSEVECFSVRDGQYHRVLGEDAHCY